jgi:hypothetical protein
MLPPTLYFVRFFDKLRMTVLINTEPLSVIMHAPFNHAENTYCHSEHTRFPVTLNEVEGSHRAEILPLCFDYGDSSTSSK